MLAPGTILGPYRVVAKIGEGGMGEVYKARDERLERTVALKLLPDTATENAVLRERLHEEARALSRLNHPHICTLYDVIDVPSTDGAPVTALVMEFLEGESLARRLERGALPVEQALVLGAQVADALDKAHRAGIVHGDLKPGNVMLTRAGAKLLDFGLARRRGTPLPTDWADAVTRSVDVGTPGPLVGTLQYLAPEQLEGRAADERADIFAFGAVLFEMVTGRPAFSGETPAVVIAAILKQEPPAVSSVVPEAPPTLDRLVGACLAKDPDDRWQHAGDLARELRWMAGPRPAPPAAPPSARPRRLAWPWQVATGVLLVALLALGGLLVNRDAPTVVPPLRSSILLPDGLRFQTAGTVGGGGRLALSPDGRMLALVATDATGTQMLWLRSLSSQSLTPLPGTEGGSSPFWSPDSRFVAFVAQGQLKRIDTNGGEAAVVAEPAFPATGAWSRSGEILFTPTATAALSLVPDTGGTPRAVTTLDEAAGDQVHRNPSFLPDGRHFVYVAVGGRNGTSAARRAAYVGSMDGGTPVHLIDGIGGARFSGGMLLFLRESTLLAQEFDVDRLVLTGEPKLVTEQVETGGAVAGSFAVAESGLLAFQPASTAGSQLAWFDREGRQLGTVGDPADYADVELSPDGRLVAVSVLDPAVGTRDLWVIDVVRGVRTRFTRDRSDDVAPIWSRDGSRILFTSNRGGHFDLYEKAASGIGDETLVYADDTDKYPTSWLSDAGLILYWTFNAEGTRLQLLPTSEGGPRTFLPSPISPGRFSPDGRHVLYYSTESGRSEVYLVPFPTPTRRWQISSNGGNFARWRPDGREVYYVGRDNRLMATTVDATGERVEIGTTVSLFDARPVGARYPFDVAPGGERFLVNTVRGSSAVASVTLIQNWRSLLEP